MQYGGGTGNSLVQHLPHQRRHPVAWEANLSGEATRRLCPRSCDSSGRAHSYCCGRRIGGATETEAGAGIGAIIGLLLLLAYIIWALVLFARGTTPGKKVLGMRVINEDGTPAGFMTMLLREWIGKWISGLILSLGFLWILFDKDNQGWHDKLMSTYVVTA